MYETRGPESPSEKFQTHGETETGERIIYTTKPFCWPIRDTDEGRCHVLPSTGPLQVVSVRGKTLETCSQSLWMFSVHSSLRQRILEIVEWKWFDRFILFLILLNSILLAAYQYRASDDNDFNYFVDKVADPIFTLFFSLECVMKVIAQGLFFDRNAYLRDAWNAFDFVVVVSALLSLVIGGDNLNILRVFRVLRPLRSINALPDLKRYVLTMLNSIPQLVDVSIMGLFLFVIFGIVGITLWDGVYYRQCRMTPNPVLSSMDGVSCWEWLPTGEDRLCGGRYTCLEGGWCGGHIKDKIEDYRPAFPNGSHQSLPWCPMNGRTELRPIDRPTKLKPQTDFIHFDNIGGALLVVFQSMTMEGWVDIMYEIQDGDSITLATVYWFFLITFASFFLLNIFLAVIDESFNTLEAQMQEEELIRKSSREIDSQRASDFSSESSREADEAAPELTAMALIASETQRSSLHSVPSADSGGQESWLQQNIFEPTRALAENERFADFIMFFIVANTVTMSLEKFPPDLALQEFLSVCEWIFLIVFSLEMLLFLVAWGPVKYVKNPLTLFDGAIVILSILEKFLSDTAALRAFRGFRLVRVVFKIARRWGSFRVLLKAMIKMMDSLKFFALLFLLVLYVFTLLFLVFFSTKFRFQDEEHAQRLVNDESAWCTGPQFPGPENDDCIPRAHFDTFVWAFVTVFQIMSGENWNMVMYDGMRAGGWGTVFFFVFVIIFGQIMILNLFLTILMAKFQEARPALQEEEIKKQEESKIKKQKQNTKKELKKFMKTSGTGGWNSTLAEVRKTVAVAEVRESLGCNASLYQEFQRSKTTSGSTVVLESVSTFPSKEGSNPKLDANSSRTSSTPPAHHDLGRVSEERVIAGLHDTTERVPVFDLQSTSAVNGEGTAALDSDLALQEPMLEAPTVLESQNLLPGQLLTTPPEMQRPAETAAAQMLAGEPEAEAAAAQMQAGEPEVSCARSPSKTLGDLQTIKTMTVTEPSSTMPLRSAGSGGESSPQAEDLETRALLQQAPTSRKSWVQSHINLETFETAISSSPSMMSLNPNRRWPYGYSLFIFSERNRLRITLRDIVYQKNENGQMKAFDKFILACIFLSSVCMAFDSPLWNPKNVWVEFLRTLDEVFMYIFLVEMVLKLIAQGFFWGQSAYLRSGWNWLDGTVVVVSVVGKLDPKRNAGFLRTLRILRAFRPLRAISRYENLKVVVRTIFKSFKELLILGVLTFVFFLVIGILFVSQLNGLFNKCDMEGVGPLSPISFTTPLCLGSGRDSVCAAGFYNKSAPGEWQDEGCLESCGGPAQVAPMQPWRRPSDDTPICLGHCNPKARDDAGLPPQDICPPLLTSVEQFPKNCDGTLNLDLDDTNNTPEELVGINYVRTMMMERVLRCGGSDPGSCQDLFCPEGVSDSDKKTCRGNCWKHPNFCFDTCKSFRSSGDRDDVAADSLCGQCLSECEASCHCQDFCTGVIKDAAVCTEQGGKWQPTISQNFNNVFNAFLTLVEISTTEMWLDVMHNAVDGTSHYRQPQRDNQLIWTFAFMIFIFSGNMIILNLGVGVIVENFIAIKESDGGILLTANQEAWIKSQKNLFERRLFFPLTNLHLRSPLRRKVFKLIDSKAFEHFIMGAIVLNTACMMLQIFPEPYDWWEQMVEVGNYTFAVLFTMEFFLKMMALRRNYWQDTWNLFDFFVVVTTLVGILISGLSQSGEGTNAGSLGSVVSVIRIFRIARLFRLIRFLKGLNKIFMALLLSVPRLMNVFFLLLLMLILYSILGVQLFAKVKFNGLLDDHGNFRNFFWAFVTLFRSMTGEAWNEIMHDLSKDETDFLRAGSWCSPPDLFDEVNKYEVLKDKCLIDHPNSCGTRMAHIIYFVTYIFIVYFIVFNLLIAVILEGYDEGKNADEKELIDECIKLWKKYDPNLTMALNYQLTFEFIEEALKLQADQATRGGYFRRTIVRNVSSIEHIPMRYARALEHLSVNEEGKIQFLMAVKFVFRMTIAKNNLDILQEIEASDKVLESAGNSKLLQKLRKLEQKQTSRHGLQSNVTLQAQVAATKIQRFYQSHKAAREERRRISRIRKKSDNVDCCDDNLREEGDDREVAQKAGHSNERSRKSSLERLLSSSKDSLMRESAAADSPEPEIGVPPVDADAHAREGIAAAAEADAAWAEAQTGGAHLEPRSGAACDGLDEPRNQRRITGGCGEMEIAAEASPQTQGTPGYPPGKVANPEEPEREPPSLQIPQEVMVPPVAG